MSRVIDCNPTAGPFTLLAPTDAAFKAVPEAALAKLLATPADLKKLLLSHVLPAAVFRFGAATGDAVTVAGTPVAVTVTGNEMEGTTWNFCVFPGTD